jgi:hypothetical protein
MMEVTGCSKTSVLTRATRRHIPVEGILYSHHHESLKSYLALTRCTLSGDVIFPVRYELNSYIPENCIPRDSHAALTMVTLKFST